MKITVLGAGSWGTALAKLLADKEHDVTLWGRREDQTSSIQTQRENVTFLPGITLPPRLNATSDLEKALDGAQMLLIAVPTHGLREVLRMASTFMPTGIPIVSATKGVENETLMMINEVVEAEIPSSKGHFAALSGPSFAKEVATGQPTVVVAAAHDIKLAQHVQQAFFSDGIFRVYVSTDLIGVELGGALKNVIAIAAGASDGMGFGHNARAALITRGVAEMAQIVVRMGGEPLTVAGLAGMGDLVLTCTGELSRNRHVGIELGRGRKLAEILGGMRQVAEGVRTARSAFDLARREKVVLPIMNEVYEVLYKDKDPRVAVYDLMVREAHREFQLD